MSLTLAQRVIAENVTAFWEHPEERAIAYQAAAEAVRMFRAATYPPAPNAFDAYEDAAHIAEHLNGRGSPPAPELADHIAKCIRDAASAIETQSATTAGRGPEDESAAPKVDAQTSQVRDHD